MKVLKVIFGIITTLGFIGMLSSDPCYDYWWIVLLISFGVFLIGIIGITFIENRYIFYSWGYGIVAVLGAFFYPVVKNKELTKGCFRLLKKCNSSYYNLFITVKNRYIDSLF